MARINLHATYKDRNVLKRGGAKYDAETKTWFIDDENAEQMSNLPVFRRFLDIEWYIEKRLSQIDVASKEAQNLLEWKTHLEDAKIRRENGEKVYVNLDPWFGWNPGD